MCLTYHDGYRCSGGGGGSGGPGAAPTSVLGMSPSSSGRMATAHPAAEPDKPVRPESPDSTLPPAAVVDELPPIDVAVALPNKNRTLENRKDSAAMG